MQVLSMESSPAIWDALRDGVFDDEEHVYVEDSDEVLLSAIGWRQDRVTGEWVGVVFENENWRDELADVVYEKRLRRDIEMSWR